MGNVLQTIRLSLLRNKITTLVEVMPKSMVTWKNRNEVVSTLSPSNDDMKVSLAKVQEDKPGLGKIREPPNELDLGSDDAGCSVDLREISLCTDVYTDDEMPSPRKDVQANEEVPVVDWDYMSTVPVFTWEELTEEQLWDDYTRQHTPPAGSIPLEEFCRTEDEKESTKFDVKKSADGDTVILFQRSRKNRCLNSDQPETEASVGDGQIDSQPSKKNPKSKWYRFSFLLFCKRFRIKDPIFRANRSFMKGGTVT